MKNEVKLLIVIGVAVVGVALIAMNYYRGSVQNVRVTGNSNTGAPTLNPEVLIRPDSPTLGPANAPVAIVEFLDPECESCAAFGPSVKRIVKEFDGQTKLVIRYMPLHPNSMLAGAFLEYAGEKGKYWETVDLIFQKQPEWGERHGAPPASQPNAPALFEKYAGQLGLDWKEIDAAFKSGKYKPKFDRDLSDGRSIGVRQTPTIFVNGKRLMRLSESDLRALVQSELGR
jgi:protein-disulfide isomerase